MVTNTIVLAYRSVVSGYLILLLLLVLNKQAKIGLSVVDIFVSLSPVIPWSKLKLFDFDCKFLASIRYILGGGREVPPNFGRVCYSMGAQQLMFCIFKKVFSEIWGLCCFMGPDFSREICQKFDIFS